MDASGTAATFRVALLDAGLLVATSVGGLYHRSRSFEQVVRGVEQAISAAGADLQAPMYYLPAIMPRDVLERTDYLRSFPDLIGSIDVFVGNDRAHADLLRLAEAGSDWTTSLSAADVVLCPAACHAVYPMLHGTQLPAGGQHIECQGTIFRHEPSLDPARMQNFRMHEFVYVGEPEAAVKQRDVWLERALDQLNGLGLAVEPVVANDPFFGRAGRILAINQLETTSKYELIASITSEAPTAIASVNCHQDHFSVPFEITTAEGATAHSACIGFGLERITLALLSRHGLDPDRWPATVRDQLWP